MVTALIGEVRVEFEISYYHDYISRSFAKELLTHSKPLGAVNGLRMVDRSPEGLETDEALGFLCELYEGLKPDLQKVLEQRILDRRFIDERVRACYQFNQSMGRSIENSDYQTILGLEDSSGRVVIGPKTSHYCRQDSSRKPVAPIPAFLQGPHVTLFGPPESAKMSINAMNAYHRKLKGEPAIVEELLRDSETVPFWGADDEDSKTPLHEDLVSSGVNLSACFEGTIQIQESEKKYELAQDHLSIPIKRFPGLALPCSFLFLHENPIPLHLYDFALHLFHNHHHPKSLTFYVPKLENEEEARYIHKMIQTAELMIQKINPQYQAGTIRLMIVLENPRAILRVHEMMDALHPYFVGASLGWHDYLGSTARLLKEDGNYRIPVKADPHIVIKYIKASHLLLADVVGSRGGIKVGGMYGILPQTPDLKSDSFQITMRGYIQDVITQLKRDLTGFWVAHPDFVRLGIAFVKAWEIFQRGNRQPLFTLVRELLNPQYHQEIEDFILKKDIAGLDPGSPQYVRSLIVADIKESDYRANNDPEEIRFNVFQSLQYLTDWLSGNGCVALPAEIEGIAVRVMDDLATAERSRWEVWHEIYHGRFSTEDFLRIVQEEIHFIRKDLSNDKKIVQVKWNEKTAKWYPVAMHLMIKLMTSPSPAEFATELLLPFTFKAVRDAIDPLHAIQKIDPEKYQLDPKIERFLKCFDICGSQRFATILSKGLVVEEEKAKEIIFSFSKEEVIEAAAFHGNIGESKKTLDEFAQKEQALVFQEDKKIKAELQILGAEYLQKFGIKFLISAKDKTGKELLAQLKSRLHHSFEEELFNAKEALWQISKKRMEERPLDLLTKRIQELQKKYQIHSASISILEGGDIQSLCFGSGVNENSLFEIASLSKPIAAAFAIEYFQEKGIPLTTFVNSLFNQTKSHFRIEDGDKVCLEHLMNHSALSMHYVKGISLQEKMPSCEELLNGSAKFQYEKVRVLHLPGTKFHYSGGGFLVLQHLIESLEGKSIQEITAPYFRKLGIEGLTFESKRLEGLHIVDGYFDDGKMVPDGRLMFPAFAAGGLGSSKSLAIFLQKLGKAFRDIKGVEGISHDTAVRMLHGTDRGCKDFMGALMGLGIFVAECGPNKLMLHQGANEGYRSIFVHCYDGPSSGKGFVVFCNADNKGVLFNAQVAQEILRTLMIEGLDSARFLQEFDFSQFSQEQIVNMGYKKLVFDAFLPSLPEKITQKGPKNQLSDWNILNDAKIEFVTNQKFARVENLISPFEPTFDPTLFGKQGKIMDSWESTRHNQQGCDEAIFHLNQPVGIQYIFLSTKYHDGNQAEYVRILGRSHKQEWREFFPKTQMKGHSFLKVKLEAKTEGFEQIKIEMYPDGGLTRVGLYRDLPENEAQSFFNMATVIKTQCVRYSEVIPKTSKPLSIPYSPSLEEVKKNLQCAQCLDLASLAFGAKMISATNEHYGPALQLLSPYPPLNMFDGLESARSRKLDHFEEALIQLAWPSALSQIILDFQYFVNNNPLFVEIQGLNQSGQWVSLVEKTNVKAFAGNKKSFFIQKKEVISQLKLKTIPDGGINRLHVFAAEESMRLK